MQLKENIRSNDGWALYENEFDAQQMITAGSNYMIGNGYLGYRGTFPGADKTDYVGCVVTDTFDNADGKWKELCTVPNTLYTQCFFGDQPLELRSPWLTDYYRELNVRKAVHRFKVSWKLPSGVTVTMESDRFSSLADLHLLAERYTLSVDAPVSLDLETGIQGEMWSLNGNHFDSQKVRRKEDVLITESVTGEKGIRIITAAVHLVEPELSRRAELKDVVLNGCKGTLQLTPEQPVVITKLSAIFSTRDVVDPESAALILLDEAREKGWEKLVDEQDCSWADFWNVTDIQVEGDPLSQILLRYNMYHNRISAPLHTDHHPIGARGLSCQAYQGAAFWDQEIFNLPMFLYTQPQAARNLLVYRYKTLDGARRKAQKLGYQGAFYAWISGDTGDELCPSFFFKDILTGRKIHNHFNDWQMHVSPDIVYALWQYWEATGDWAFFKEMGAEMIFEICRFIFSFGFYKPHKDRYEIIRVLGPDEYHENVDNNFFTNYQCQFALWKGCEIYRKLQKEDPSHLEAIGRKIGLKARDVEDWETMAGKMYIPLPDSATHVIEQFDRYFDLEDITPQALKERLLDPGEYWGWPNGIAVETQVLKQADVIQLFALHDEAYPEQVMKANFDYYEPRTQHGSSLSYSVYSLIAARIGEMAMAYDYFIQSCTVDLFNTGKAISGGTFIGGIHTAACGAAWQMAVKGFAGFDVESEGVSFHPALPNQWASLSFPLTLGDSRIRVTLTHDHISVLMETGNNDIPVSVAGRTSFWIL